VTWLAAQRESRAQRFGLRQLAAAFNLGKINNL
jgi:hypothetical protein